jgi:hypothetical protein
MENVRIFYVNLEYCTAISYILWPFGGNLVYFPPFLVYCVKKNLATLIGQASRTSSMKFRSKFGR